MDPSRTIIPKIGTKRIRRKESLDFTDMIGAIRPLNPSMKAPTTQFCGIRVRPSQNDESLYRPRRSFLLESPRITPPQIASYIAANNITVKRGMNDWDM